MHFVVFYMQTPYHSVLCRALYAITSLGLRRHAAVRENLKNEQVQREGLGNWPAKAAVGALFELDLSSI